MENEINKNFKHKCACCGFYTITEIHETCPVCFWEEDFYQEGNIDDDGGPNQPSLRIARKNFLEFKVKDIEYITLVRPPYQDELE